MGKVLKGAKVVEKLGSKARNLRRACKCFLPGTKVLMGDRTKRNIEDIKKNDVVLATDPVTGETSNRRVEQRIVTEDDKRFNELTIATRKGPAKLTATYEHPFWSPSEQRWLRAGQIKPGVSLLSSDRTTVKVEGNRAYTQHARTFNLTVEGVHTYYVLAGSAPVLVHNTGECPIDGLRHGDLGEAATHQRLKSEGYTNITREVRFLNSNGDIFRADFVAQHPSGKWKAIEVKTGKGASLTGNQVVGYADLGKTGAELRSGRLPGFKKGSTVKMDVEIDLWRCGACNP